MNPYHQGQLDFFCAIYSFINSARLLYGLQLERCREILATALQEISERPALWYTMLGNQTDHHWVLPYMLGRFGGPGGLPMRVAQLPEKPLLNISEPDDKELCEWLRLAPPEPINLNMLGPEHIYRPDVEFGINMPLPDLRTAPASRQWSPEKLWELLQRWLPSKKFMGSFSAPQKQQCCVILRFHRFLLYQPTPAISHWTSGQHFAKNILHLFDCTANKEATHSLNLQELALYPEQIGGRRLFAVEPQSVIFLVKA